MVLVVIPEKIAADKRPYVVPELAARPVRIVGSVLAAVGQVGPEKE